MSSVKLQERLATLPINLLLRKNTISCTSQTTQESLQMMVTEVRKVIEGGYCSRDQGVTCSSEFQNIKGGTQRTRCKFLPALAIIRLRFAEAQLVFDTDPLNSPAALSHSPSLTAMMSVIYPRTCNTQKSFIQIITHAANI